MKKINSHYYLNNVLTTWTQFNKGHRRFVEALQELINENKLLKTELEMYEQEHRR